MTEAFLWGLVASLSLVIGGLIALWFKPGKRLLGVVMGFGAGVLISAIAYEMVYGAISLAPRQGYATLGFLLGAATFYVCDMLIGRIGGGERKAIGAAHPSSMAVPLVLAIILDGVPESVVIGLGVLEGGTVSLAMLVAVFMSNLPEAVASTAGMRSGGWSSAKIMLLWSAIALVCAVASAAGFGLLGGVSPQMLSIVQAFAGGAILMMLANTMIPEAYGHGGKLAGVFTVLGFVLAVWIVVLEHAAAGHS